MNDAPKENENHAERDTSTPAVPAQRNNILSRFAPVLGILGFIGSCICVGVALALRHLAGIIMLRLADYAPDYVVVGCVTAVGMIGWLLLLKAIKANIPGAGVWFTFGWAGFVCLGYGYAFEQGSKQGLSGWTWLGTVFWLACIGTAIATRKSGKKEKTQGMTDKGG